MIATADLERVALATARELAALRELERVVRALPHTSEHRPGVRAVPCAVCDELDKVDAVRRGEVEWSV